MECSVCKGTLSFAGSTFFATDKTFTIDPMLMAGTVYFYQCEGCGEEFVKWPNKSLESTRDLDKTNYVGPNFPRV